MRASFLTTALAGAIITCGSARDVLADPGPSLGITVHLAKGGGLRIQSVSPGSVADDLGLVAGEILVEINGTLITSLAQAHQLIDNSGDHVSLLVLNTNKEFEQLDADLETDSVQGPGVDTASDLILVAGRRSKPAMERPTTTKPGKSTKGQSSKRPMKVRVVKDSVNRAPDSTQAHQRHARLLKSSSTKPARRS